MLINLCRFLLLISSGGAGGSGGHNESVGENSASKKQKGMQLMHFAVFLTLTVLLFIV